MRPYTRVISSDHNNTITIEQVPFVVNNQEYIFKNSVKFRLKPEEMDVLTRYDFNINNQKNDKNDIKEALK